MTTYTITAVAGMCISLVLAPLVPGIINRVKAIMGGRKGKPLLLLYYDLIKLMRKSPVYSHTTTWFFRASPSAGIAAGMFALCVLPFSSWGAIISFPGDFLVLAGAFGLSRFALILSALDTGSAFEGMGAAREAVFSAMAEPIFLFCLVIFGYQSGQLTLAGMLISVAPEILQAQWPFYLMLAFALFLVLLLENSRIPVDDPNTHLELTMIHEVMILDHSGPDLALLEYASALKLWVFCLLIAGVLLPVLPGPHSAADLALNGLCTLLIIGAIAVFVGLVESLMARMRMERVPQVLTVAGSLAGLAALMLWR